MVTKHQFDLAANQVRNNLAVMLPKMIGYKSVIQKKVLDMASAAELQDVHDCRINQGLVDKLVILAKKEWLTSPDAQSLYSAAIAVGTIVKEYDWGVLYLIGDGLWEIANRIQNA